MNRLTSGLVWVLLTVTGTAVASPPTEENVSPSPARVDDAATEHAPLLERRHGALIGLTTRRFERSLELEQGGQVSEDRDGLWKAIGLFAGYRLAYTDPGARRGHLRGDFELGVEFMPHTGGIPLTFQHSTAWVWRFKGDFWLSLGLRVGFSVDLPDVDYSHAELSMPLGLGWRWLELQGAPGFTVPLARETRPVYGGELSRGAAVSFMPVNLALVFRVF
jgi:hypothetical protein